MELSFQCNLKFLESFDSDVIQTECYKDSGFSRNYVEFLLLKRSYYSYFSSYTSLLLQIAPTAPLGAGSTQFGLRSYFHRNSKLAAEDGLIRFFKILRKENTNNYI